MMPIRTVLTEGDGRYRNRLHRSSDIIAAPTSTYLRRCSIGALIALFSAIVIGCDNTGSDVHYPPDIRELPLIELQASGSSTNSLAIIVTGDGGWAKLVRSVGQQLAREGIPVIALSAPRYFWTPRTPDESAATLARIIRWFAGKTGHHRVLLVGYSRGADVLPFMVNRLPPQLRALIDLTVLIGPEPAIAFQFHLTDWIPFLVPVGLPVLPEVLKLTDQQVLCIYGMEERDSICPDLHSTSVTLAPLPGGHHFNGAYELIGDRVLEQFTGVVRNSAPKHQSFGFKTC